MGTPEHTNRILPRVSSATEPALAKMINTLAEALEEAPAHREFVAGKGIRIINEPNNTIIELGAPNSRGTKWYPFKLYQQDPANKPLEVSVFYGTISGNVPVIKGAGGGGAALGTPINVSMNEGQDQEQLAAQGLVVGQPWLTAGEQDDGEYQIWIEYTPVDYCETVTDPPPETPAYVGDVGHPNEVIIGKKTIPPPSDLAADRKPIPPNLDRLPPEVGENNGVMPLQTTITGYVEVGRVVVFDERIVRIHNSLTHSLMHTSCGTKHFFWGV